MNLSIDVTNKQRRKQKRTVNIDNLTKDKTAYWLKKSMKVRLIEKPTIGGSINHKERKKSVWLPIRLKRKTVYSPMKILNSRLLVYEITVL